eukprot:NODE_13448_length_1165_cov_6.050096.p1 GENE.NODE_13448_length_1165_cov_6.050096~~NODE_13448_length_1165_cov_6.050096.p1  ORF type:complete len:377 (+),score=51.62 NODE_13448_length_1165_cov_6.050096:71-1132(+)
MALRAGLVAQDACRGDTYLRWLYDECHCPVGTFYAAALPGNSSSFRLPCQVLGREVFGVTGTVCWFAGVAAFTVVTIWASARLHFLLRSTIRLRVQIVLHSLVFVAALLRLLYIMLEIGIALQAVPGLSPPSFGERVMMVVHTAYFPAAAASVLSLCSHWEKNNRTLDLPQTTTRWNAERRPDRPWALFSGGAFFAIGLGQEVLLLQDPSSFLSTLCTFFFVSASVATSIYCRCTGRLLYYRVCEISPFEDTTVFSWRLLQLPAVLLALSAVIACSTYAEVVLGIAYYAWPQLASRTITRILEALQLLVVLVTVGPAHNEEMNQEASSVAGSFFSTGTDATPRGSMELFMHRM